MKKQVIKIPNDFFHAIDNKGAPFELKTGRHVNAGQLAETVYNYYTNGVIEYDTTSARFDVSSDVIDANGVGYSVKSGYFSLCKAGLLSASDFSGMVKEFTERSHSDLFVYMLPEKDFLTWNAYVMTKTEFIDFMNLRYNGRTVATLRKGTIRAGRCYGYIKHYLEKRV